MVPAHPHATYVAVYPALFYQGMAPPSGCLLEPPFTKFSQKILKTLSEALETLIFEFLIENCVETVKKVFFWQN